MYTKRTAILGDILFKLQKILKNGALLLKKRRISYKLYFKAVKEVARFGHFFLSGSYFVYLQPHRLVNRINL